MKSLLKTLCTFCWTVFLLWIGQYIPHSFFWIGALVMSFLFIVGFKVINKIFPK